MIKKTIMAAIAVSVFAGGIMTSKVSAEPGKDLQIIPIIVNGQKVRFPDTEPYMNTDGRTMVPVRFVSEMLGAEVTWENSTQTAIIQYEGKTIRMPIGSKTVSVDGEDRELDTAAEKYDGRTMVPLRFVSEVLGSGVEWDGAAHSVKVTDAKYQTKVDSGEVKLDPWGREYSKTQDNNWIRLTDLEGVGFYKSFSSKSKSRVFIEWLGSAAHVRTGNVLASKIRSYYAVQLNVDYRTINEDDFIKAFMASASGNITKNELTKSQFENIIRKYVKWVKENKVIAKGYADPELSAVYETNRTTWIPTHFKFMIISANDSNQAFLDSWDVSFWSDPVKLKTGVWYDGYSNVRTDSNVASALWGEDHGLSDTENMFIKDSYFYNVEVK
ncbi:copper amine oxidase N-terminal domain-containing protein [Cohnella cellulosilytica]|uniref:Copper amine oxidase N-terminal domain-containing protein n=1 Tax=Cohnella cellulosilytica TaxID=986710 RepID=A0ABW2F207_9BACL